MKIVTTWLAFSLVFGFVLGTNGNDVAIPTSLLPVLTQGGSFALVCYAVVYLVPKGIRDLITSREDLNKTFREEVEAVRERADARAERLSARIVSLQEQVIVMQQKLDHLIILTEGHRGVS